MDVRELLKITSAGIKVFERQEDKVCGLALCALRDCCFCPACAFCGVELRCLSGMRTSDVGLRCARCAERVFSFPLDEVCEVCVCCSGGAGAVRLAWAVHQASCASGNLQLQPPAC